MESILPSYRDPLFSIILIIMVSLMIAIVTYAWGAYSQQKEKSTLRKFLEKFENAECALDTSNMPFDIAIFNPLVLLAKAFENSGEYHKAINIYLYLIKHISNHIDKAELMERLGQTYLRAGFLERARAIFSEILHKRPRNRQVLYELGIVYEMMHQYDKALEVIEPLKILGEQTYELEKFLHFQKMISDKSILPKDKTRTIIQLLEEEPMLYRPTMALLFKLDISKAWGRIESSSIYSILDMLWILPYGQLDIEMVSKNNTLTAIYYAKGYLGEEPQKCGIFAIDMLVAARISGLNEEGDLLFSYLCTKCKQIFPVPFARCPSCLALNKMELEVDIVKKVEQTENSLL